VGEMERGFTLIRVRWRPCMIETAGGGWAEGGLIVADPLGVDFREQAG